MANQKQAETIDSTNDSLTNYELISELGRGAHGIVYKSKRLSDNKIVVLKCVSTSNLKTRSKNDIIQEANFLKSLKHPHIVKYLSCFFDDLSFYIVMEYAEKGDLYKITKSMKKLKRGFSEDEIWRLAGQLFSALEFIHEHKIVHRDIKPLNIFLDRNNNIKVGDFGVSKFLDPNNDLRKTKVGTPLYIAPEVVQHFPYDSRADIWSAGCALYYIIMQRVPFYSENVISLGFLIVNKDHDPLPESYSKELKDLIDACMQKQAEKRPSASSILYKYSYKFGNHINRSKESKKNQSMVQMKEQMDLAKRNDSQLMGKQGMLSAQKIKSQSQRLQLADSQVLKNADERVMEYKPPADRSVMFKKKSKMNLKENILVYNNMIIDDFSKRESKKLAEEAICNSVVVKSPLVSPRRMEYVCKLPLSTFKQIIGNKNEIEDHIQVVIKPNEKVQKKITRPSSVAANKLLQRMEERNELKHHESKLNAQYKRIGLPLNLKPQPVPSEKMALFNLNNFVKAHEERNQIKKPNTEVLTKPLPKPLSKPAMAYVEAPKAEAFGLSFFHDSAYDIKFQAQESRPGVKARPRTAILPQQSSSLGPKPRLLRPNTAVFKGICDGDYLTSADNYMDNWKEPSLSNCNRLGYL